MNYVSFTIDAELKNKIENFYRDYQLENTGDYVSFFAKVENTTITIYTSKKGHKVIFAGPNALYEARIFKSDAELSTPKERVVTNFITFQNQIGSDEVGFGDFFGPLVVVSCYFDENLINELSNINDSKKITDKFILEYIPTIIDKLSFSKLTVDNEKYNSLIEKGLNLNEIKAKLHNRALFNLKKKHPNCTNFYIDQFCSPDHYFLYNKFELDIVDNITFKTKAESMYPCVALASMIARYCFLKEMEILNNKYQMEFPKGAGIQADKFVQDFIKVHGIDELRKVAKLNFSNYKNIINKETTLF